MLGLRLRWSYSVKCRWIRIGFQVSETDFGQPPSIRGRDSSEFLGHASSLYIRSTLSDYLNVNIAFTCAVITTLCGVTSSVGPGAAPAIPGIDMAPACSVVTACTW